MPKLICSLAALLTVCIFCSSCETVKGAASGLCQDVKNTKNNIIKVGKSIKQADQKMQENYW